VVIASEQDTQVILLLDLFEKIINRASLSDNKEEAF
jgi:hypothetical protein